MRDPRLPPMHNIPIRSDLGREIRRGFIDPTDPFLASIDYSGFEMKMMAAMAEAMKEKP